MKLIKFSAGWCGPCKQQANEFKENLIKVPIENIDIDEDSDGLATKFNVRSIPTMILMDDNNQEIHRWVGVTKSEVINSYIDGLDTGTTQGE